MKGATMSCNASKEDIPKTVCRHQQDKLLSSLFTSDGATVPCIFIYGHTASGKSVCLRNVFDRKEVVYVKVHCAELYSVRLIYEHIITEISGSQSDRCDDLNTFIRLLHNAVKDHIEGQTLYLAKSSVCVILESEIIWENLRQFTTGCREPVALHFPPYTKAELEGFRKAERDSNGRQGIGEYVCTIEDSKLVVDCGVPNMPVLKEEIKKSMTLRKKIVSPIWAELEAVCRESRHDLLDNESAIQVTMNPCDGGPSEGKEVEKQESNNHVVTGGGDNGQPIKYEPFDCRPKVRYHRPEEEQGTERMNKNGKSQKRKAKRESLRYQQAIMACKSASGVACHVSKARKDDYIDLQFALASISDTVQTLLESTNLSDAITQPPAIDWTQDVNWTPLNNDGESEIEPKVLPASKISNIKRLKRHVKKVLRSWIREKHFEQSLLTEQSIEL